MPPFTSFRISICGLQELDAFVGQRVSHVVSILDPEWPDPDVFRSFPRHERTLWRFDDVVEEKPEAQAPGPEHVEKILDLGESLSSGEVDHLLVHCHAGISRSTATAVILMAQRHPGKEREVFEALRVIRPRSWPNSRMIDLADDMLGRAGALGAAVREHHRRVARDWPDLAEIISRHGRAHEVALPSATG